MRIERAADVVRAGRARKEGLGPAVDHFVKAALTREPLDIVEQQSLLREVAGRCDRLQARQQVRGLPGLSIEQEVLPSQPRNF